MRHSTGRHGRPVDRTPATTAAAPAGRHARPAEPRTRRRASAPVSPAVVAIPAVALVLGTVLAALLGVLPGVAAPAPGQVPAAATPAATPAPATSSPPSTATTAPATAAAPALPKDPAVAAKLIAELRPKIAAASAAHDAAQTELVAADAAVQAAQQHAIAAERIAGDARDTLASWAAYLYRSGGGAGLVTQLLDAVDDDPQAFLRATGDAAIVGDGLAYDLVRAQATLAESRLATQQAAELAVLAEQHVAQAEAARATLADLLARAQALVNASKGASGPQTLITAAGCPKTVPAGTLRDGSATVTAFTLCRDSVKAAATPQAALAIQAAFRMLGAPYACKGVGRMDPFRFDCSSLVSRAYYLGAGLETAGASWAPSTRDMVPWDGVALAGWASYVAPAFVRPGDLVLYDTGGAAYRHVVMYLADGYMLHTNSCGDVAHVSSFSGFGISPGHAFLVARRVLAPGAVRIPDPVPVPTSRPVPGKPKPNDGAGDPPAPKPPTTPTTPVPTPAPTTTSPTGDATTTSPDPTTTSPSTSPTTTSPPAPQSSSGSPSTSSTSSPAGQGARR